MGLTGKFKFRKKLWGKIVLQVEEEVKPFWSKAGALKRRWRDAALMDLASPEMRDLIDLQFKAPALISVAGDRAAYRFLEFFTAQIRNPHTRRAYGRAVSAFCAWLEARGLPSISSRRLDPRRGLCQGPRPPPFRPDCQAAPGCHSDDVRLARDRRHPALQPGHRRARAEARGQARQAPRARPRGSPAAPRQHRREHPCGSARPGADLLVLPSR